MATGEWGANMPSTQCQQSFPMVKAFTKSFKGTVEVGDAEITYTRPISM